MNPSWFLIASENFIHLHRSVIVDIATIVTPVILALGIIIDLHYRKRKLVFTNFNVRPFIQQTSPPRSVTILDVNFSGNCERGVKVKNLLVLTKNGLWSDRTVWAPYSVIEDGESNEIQCQFDSAVILTDIYKVIITDSTNGKYKKYAYGGIFRNRFVVWVLSLKDKISTIF